MDTGCLFQQSLSLFGEMDRITATVFGFCAALDQFATLKDIEQTDKVSFFDSQRFAKLSLRDSWIGSDEHERAELRRSQQKGSHYLVKLLRGKKACKTQRVSDAVSKVSQIDLSRNSVLHTLGPGGRSFGCALSHRSRG